MVVAAGSSVNRMDVTVVVDMMMRPIRSEECP